MSQARVTASVPSAFESFNARALHPDQVAKTFVPPPTHWPQLIKRSHTIVLGPRGSGKTTLLKMLQAPALEAWRHPDAEDYRGRIDYTGVFIPTDVSWSQQLNVIGAGSLTQQSREVLSQAAFTTHVLRCFVATIRDRLTGGRPGAFRPVVASVQGEADAANEAAKLFSLEIRAPTMLAVEIALGDRLADIQRHGRRFLSEPKPEFSAPDWMFIDWLSALSAFADRIQRLDGDTDRWALLFDELELAPDTIRTQLLGALRSSDSRFLFKLSLSPYAPGLEILSMAGGPMPNQDYEQVSLTYARKQDGYNFCSALFESILRERGIDAVSPLQFLGESEFETPDEDSAHGRTAYRKGTKIYELIRSLAAKDESFRDYLAQNKIDLDRLEEVDEGHRAATLRKVRAVVTVREAFRGLEGETSPNVHGDYTARIRSRKSLNLYTGASAFFAMTEGNPRLLIAVTLRLLDRVDRFGRLRRAAQAAEIEIAANRFRALIRTIPSSRLPGGADFTVLALLDAIGTFFFDRTVRAPFVDDPPGTFTIDDEISSSTLAAVGYALNAGALVYVPRRDSPELMTDLHGRRLRLAYLLAPSYNLPLRIGRAVKLSAVLQRHDRPQTPLFPDL